MNPALRSKHYSLYLYLGPFAILTGGWQYWTSAALLPATILLMLLFGHAKGIVPVLAWVPDPWILLPLLLIAVIVWAQMDFYRLLSARGGAGFAIAVVPLQLLFFMGCALSVPLGLLAFLRQE